MPVRSEDPEEKVGNSGPLFRDLGGDSSDAELSVIDSLCMKCEETGTTKLLLAKIPFFKEVIISSFECTHCGFSNNEVQPANVIQDEGIRVEVRVTNPQDLNRKVVKQNSASYCIPELDFEAPAFGSVGVLTTIEGLLDSAISDLEQQQPVRKIMEPEIAEKVDNIIAKLKDQLEVKEPFTLVLEDCSGNSFIENPFAPEADPNLKVSSFQRSTEQDEKLGIRKQEDEGSNHGSSASVPIQTTGEDSGPGTAREELPVPQDEVLEFQINCPNCQSPTTEKMKSLNIPHFKEVIIMALNCDTCGYKSNDVKGGGGFEDHGTLITLKMTDASDLNRDVLKSETCTLNIPEIELETHHGGLSGKFTTVEGLLVSIKEQLQSANPFLIGDSAASEARAKLDSLLGKIDEVISGQRLVTIILDDPVSNSHIQNPCAPDPDPSLTIKTYTRTNEQNEELGIADMKTENYS